MQTPTYQDQLLRYANSKHSTLMTFECSTPRGSKTYSVFQLNRQVFETETQPMTIPPDNVVITYRETGSSIIRREGDTNPLLASPRTAAYYSAGTYQVRASKGEHRLLILCAHLREHSIVYEFLKELPFASSVKGYSDELQSMIQRLTESVASPAGSNYFGVAGTFHLTMQQLTQERYSVDMGRIPSGLSQPFIDVCERVRQDLKSDWSIARTCKLVSYSPQYFSRAFKHSAGEGFHSYVQRVRLSRAVSLLCEGEDRMPAILRKCGFSSQQAMREAFRSELGLLPADFKALGDPLLNWNRA